MAVCEAPSSRKRESAVSRVPTTIKKLGHQLRANVRSKNIKHDQTEGGGERESAKNAEAQG